MLRASSLGWVAAQRGRAAAVPRGHARWYAAATSGRRPRSVTLGSPERASQGPSHSPGRIGRLTSLYVPSPVQPRAHAAWCRCGLPLAYGEPRRMCVGQRAVQHSARVARRADTLLSRMNAVLLLGALESELA